MNYKSILFFLGIYSFFVSLFSFLNILYSFYFFTSDLSSYVITLLISLFFGFLFTFIGYRDSKNISFNEQIAFIIVSYFYLPLLISIPYLSNISEINLLNSYFESVSGFTTTGFSVINNIESYDETFLLWRSSSQWLGGLFFLVAIIGTFGSHQAKIKPAHLVYGSTMGRNFYSNFNYNFIKILLIYFVSTIFIIILYTLAEIRLLDSFNLAFTVVSSGGFISSNNLFNIARNDLQILIVSLTLLFPIFNFYLLFNIFTKNFTPRKHYEDIHLVIGIVALTAFFYFFIIPDESLSSIFLSIVSSISTSGISTYSSNLDVSLFFILLTIVGGSLISTSSGFKYIRFYILLKISYQEIYRLVKPINIVDKNLFNADSKIDDQDLKIAFLVFISLVISIFVLSSILALDNLTFENSFKLSILTLTNTTTSSLYGLDNLSFFDLNSFTKISLIIFMILGKIEIIAILYLLKRFIFKD